VWPVFSPAPVLLGDLSAFFVQNEWVRNGFFVQVAEGRFLPQNYPHEVIHNVGNLGLKRIALKINDL
jgi:hypothetical protein